MVRKKNTVTHKVSISAMVTDSHTPVRPKNIGSTITHRIWNTRVRRKEIKADTGPLFSAVKKEEP